MRISLITLEEQKRKENTWTGWKRLVSRVYTNRKVGGEHHSSREYGQCWDEGLEVSLSLELAAFGSLPGSPKYVCM